MQTKPLTYGIIGFLLGGLLVSIAAVAFDKPKEDSSMTMQAMTDSLKSKTGDDFDKAFVGEMIEHHQGAIDMAKLAQQNAKHDEVKNMAGDIIAAQSKEIDMMKTWQRNWGYRDTLKSSDMMNR